jgi:FdhD protein
MRPGPSTVAVLAGGAGERLGGHKATAVLGGRTLVEHVVASVRRAGLEPLVMAKADTELPDLDARVCREPDEPRHPLAGIFAALEETGEDLVVAPCDLPLVPARLLAWLAGLDAELAVCASGEHMQPLLGRYPARTREALAGAARESRPARESVLELGPRVVGADELWRFGDPGRFMANVNDPAGLERLESMLATERHGGASPARMLASVERDGDPDRVAVEEPLEIRVDGEAVAVTMRTPGNDEELALGFLFGEGLIDGPRPARLAADLAANVIEVEGPLGRDPAARRFYTTSSCGVCGKGALEEIVVRAPDSPPGPAVTRDLLASLPGRLEQPAFERSGGLHATGLFTAGGELLAVREDVGRHNAMDKVVGHALRVGLVPLADHLLCVSGRLAFELVQKAALAGCPVLAGVGAPTSLAVELARERGMTLAGFARGDRVAIYSDRGRVA